MKTYGDKIEEKADEIVETFTSIDKRNISGVSPSVAFVDAKMTIFVMEQALERAKAKLEEMGYDLSSEA